jgi:hypothetical protein
MGAVAALSATSSSPSPRLLCKVQGDPKAVEEAGHSANKALMGAKQERPTLMLMRMVSPSFMRKSCFDT